jgi:hypothetical protein
VKLGTREFVQILRTVFARERVDFAGDHFAIPCPRGAGLGKPLRSTVHPLRADLPVLLVARARRTSRWPPRSPTAGSRCSTRRGTTRTTARRRPRASADRAAGAP